MRVRLKQHGDDGDVFLPLPDELLREVGMREGELIEVNPHVRNVDGNKVETVLILRKLRQ